VRSTCQVNRRGAEIFKLTAEPGCKSRVTGALNNSVQIFIAKGLGRVMKALCNRIKLTPPANSESPVRFANRQATLKLWP